MPRTCFGFSHATVVGDAAGEAVGEAPGDAAGEACAAAVPPGPGAVGRASGLAPVSGDALALPALHPIVHPSNKDRAIPVQTPSCRFSKNLFNFTRVLSLPSPSLSSDVETRNLRQIGPRLPSPSNHLPRAGK